MLFPLSLLLVVVVLLMAHFHHVTHLMNVFQHHGQKKERQWIHGCVAKCHNLSKVFIVLSLGCRKQRWWQKVKCFTSSLSSQKIKTKSQVVLLKRMACARTLIRTMLFLSIDLSFCKKCGSGWHAQQPTSGDVTLAAAFIINHHPCGGCVCMIMDFFG